LVLLFSVNLLHITTPSLSRQKGMRDFEIEVMVGQCLYLAWLDQSANATVTQTTRLQEFAVTQPLSLMLN